ncbi:Uncharacterized protein FKW44_002650 [Caligus rogercresseyi]|uniref:Uncharacterized protein n=1 Tax=Caligus rogercresseyi TaxID=217165 RepID=A0A7T8KKI3_CALRO|nr:Uncharacterized protein FKW44_002650 [Caligus rogercresseyi]
MLIEDPQVHTEPESPARLPNGGHRLKPVRWFVLFSYDSLLDETEEEIHSRNGIGIGLGPLTWNGTAPSPARCGCCHRS